MIVWLSFLVCTAAGICHVTVPDIDAFAGLAACQREGELAIKPWNDNHKGWHVERVRCSIGDKPHADDRA